MFRVNVPGTDGSTGAEFGRDGQAGATAENEVPPLEGATVACFATIAPCCSCDTACAFATRRMPHAPECR